MNCDQKNGVYTSGQVITFTITAKGKQEQLAQADVKIFRDKTTEVTTPLPQDKQENGVRTVRFTPAADGWYMCIATLPNTTDPKKPLTFSCGAVVNPETFKTASVAPADFDAFWAARKAELAANPAKSSLKALTDEQKKMDPYGKPADSLEAAGVCVDLEISTTAGFQPARGYFAKPINAKPGSLPAILNLHAAGVAGAWCKSNSAEALRLAKEYKALVVDLNAHGMLNGQPEKYYTDLEANELKNYIRIGLDNREKYYFVGMYMRLIRAIDFLASQPEWDGKHIICLGTSQGGGQALAAAGLDQRVSAVCATVPALCDITAALAGHATGWPYALGGNTPEAKKVASQVIYCDAALLSARSHAQSLIFVGLIDITCPATSVYAAYNNIAAPKTIYSYPHRTHQQDLPAEAQAIGRIWDLQNAFIKKQLAQ